MYTLYKDGNEVVVDREQFTVMVEAGWSTKKEVSQEPSAPPPVENDDPESPPEAQGEVAEAEETVPNRRKK